MTVPELATDLHKQCKEDGYICAGIMVKDEGEDKGHVIVPMCGRQHEVLAAICTLIARYADVTDRSINSVLNDIVGAMSEE